MAQILDGKAQAAKMKTQLKERIAKIGGEKPCMAVVQVGDDPASTIYINQKERACAEVGITYKKVALPDNISQSAMLAEIDALNNDPTVHGFIVQQPLPSQLDVDEVVDRVCPSKDVDCLHPYNVGLATEPYGKSANGKELLLPCTPAGVIELLDAYDINLHAKHCVVVGRSRIVGKPMGMLMLGRNATVTYCHRWTDDITPYTQKADVLVVAIGVAKHIKADMIKPGCVLVDIGINRLSDKKICGDIDFDGCFEKASYITPVPGGVGPMTVAMLMANVLKAWSAGKSGSGISSGAAR